MAASQGPFITGKVQFLAMEYAETELQYEAYIKSCTCRWDMCSSCLNSRPPIGVNATPNMTPKAGTKGINFLAMMISNKNAEINKF